jgi:NADH-quinone oxidoreductase subunit F
VATQSDYLLRDRNVDWTNIDTAIKHGDYSRLKKWLSGTPEALLEEVKKASLRGRGGAGFPAGLKWSFVPQDTGKQKYLAVNADEGEPGTFKDRYWLEENPHPQIEGCILCCYAVQASVCYIYIRGEFQKGISVTEQAIVDAYAKGYLGKNIMGTGFDLEMYVHPGAGAYICGEETGMLESLEGKPGQPRMKPPFPAVEGLFGCPTVINNTETLVNVPIILEIGADAYNALGTEKNGGTKLWGISGHVKKPGLYEFPLGMNLKEIIYDHCGGILDDRELKGVIPGGASCPILTPDEIDISADFDSLKSVGSLLGTCGVIVIAEPTCIVQALLKLSSFFAHESCGQCTPCREGTGWLERILQTIEAGNGTDEHIEMLTDVCGQMEGTTICALSDAAAWPVQGVLKKFMPELKAHVDQGRCPYEEH